MQMCQAPTRLKDNTLVACRGCPICRDNRINDLVGRCIAEQSRSVATVSLTLTYAGDVPGAVFLDYRHVQNMLKSLRKAGHKVRYIVAGEYGTDKGRAHWHIILFYQGNPPAMVLERRINWPFWPHGFVYAQNPDYRGFRYVLKYVMKNENADGETKAISMSKKPPLGHAFFMQLAADLVSRGLPLQSPEYAFAHILDRHGKPRRYWLQGRMREMLCEEFCRLWSATYNTAPPWSDFLVSYLDKLARHEMQMDPVQLQTDFEKKYGLDLSNPSRTSLGMLLLEMEPRGIVEAFSDGSAIITTGENQWSISANATAAQQLLNSGVPKSLMLPVSRWLNQKWSAVSS